MALLQETPRSLRLYFGIVAAISLYIGALILARAQGQGGLLVISVGVVNILLGLVLAYIVVQFRRLIVKQPGFIRNVLLVNFSFSVLVFLLSSLQGLQAAAFLRLIVATLVFVYLLKSVTRLSKELTEAETPLPPELPRETGS